jgi:hypothetical protein
VEDDGLYLGHRLQHMKRKRVDFGQALKESAGFWDGGDALALSFLLIPTTAVWYWIAGVPHRRPDSN